MVFEILLAEDNPGDVMLFREALNNQGLRCNLSVAVDGQQAMRVLGTEAGYQPDLIVLDVNLPKDNGAAVLRHVRSLARLRGVPVIMLTSSVSPAEQEAALGFGATLFLRKPSDLDELANIGEIVKGFLTRHPTV
jgi:CheY-like chemotaxis protein